MPFFLCHGPSRANLIRSVAVENLTIAHTESSLGWGGQEMRILAEMRGLRARGHRMLLAAPKASEVGARARAEGFEVLDLAVGKLALPVNALRSAHWFGSRRVDIVNPHSSRDAWACGIGARLAGVPLVIRSRHFDVPLAYKPLSAFVYTRLADHILTTSPRITGQLRRAFPLAADRVQTMSTGIDLGLFESPDRPTDHTQDGEVVLGMIAVLRRAKGHVFLVRAGRILLDQGYRIRLLFVGDGPSKAPIEEEIARLAMSEHVTFTGHRDDVPALLRTLDCAVFPSLHEGIPQSALQAMAASVPVVGSDVGGIPSVIRAGETGRIFPAGDAEALAGQLRDLLLNQKETDRLRSNALQLVREHHSLVGMLDQLEALYEGLLPNLSCRPGGARSGGGRVG
jgi:glycosyltransferase involved in cell wall biosynthesis